MSAPTQNKTEAHRRRIQKDAREVLDRGTQYTVVIEDVTEDGTPMTHIEQVRMFIRNSKHLYPGDRLRIRVSDVGDSWAKGVVVAHLD